jgi:hypothetical protein
MQMPDNIDKALNMAIVVTNAEREEKASVRRDRGINVRVFAVRGNREVIPGVIVRNPEGNSSGAEY